MTSDLVVVFPDDPLDAVLAGESATIEVFNREMDPIQQTAIGIAARMAVQEVNATVLSTIAGEAQARVAPAAAITAQLVERRRRHRRPRSGRSGDRRSPRHASTASSTTSTR